MPLDDKAQVLQAVDIVELIGQTVALRRRGKDYVGLCPFHQEKTPSFSVSPSKQVFYCYGCKAGGTVIDFVMRRDRIEFREALETLARQAGIELSRFGGSKEKTGERQLLLDAQSAACWFFEGLLADPQRGQEARDYLAKRGFTEETCKRFRVGLAADAWDALLKGPVGKKFSPQILALAGLVKARDKGDGYYDTFRNRIMFPIRDGEGRIIAFGGRVMPGSSDPAKYLNSPETPLFSKGRCAFGLDLARKRIVETRTAVVVEGYTDVMMAHQFGASNVVSVLGTAMTEQHVAVLMRSADRIVLLFDADTAGDLAIERVVQLFLTQPVEIAVASMPAGMDPDEFLLAHGAEGFNKLVGEAPDALSYAWKQLSRRFVSHTGDLTGQQKAVEQYLELLASARGSGPVDALRWGAAVVRVSRLTEMPTEELHRRFKGQKAKARPSPAPIGEDGEAMPEPEAAFAASPRMLIARDRAERWILGTLLAEPKRWHQVQLEVKLEDFGDPLLRRLAEILWSHQRDEGEPVLNEFLSTLPEARLTQLAIELVDEVERLMDMTITLEAAVKHLAAERRKREGQRLVTELRRTGEQRLAEQDEVSLLKKLQENARKPDLRRSGS